MLRICRDSERCLEVRGEKQEKAPGGNVKISKQVKTRRRGTDRSGGLAGRAAAEIFNCSYICSAAKQTALKADNRFGEKKKK